MPSLLGNRPKGVVLEDRSTIGVSIIDLRASMTNDTLADVSLVGYQIHRVPHSLLEYQTGTIPLQVAR